MYFRQVGKVHTALLLALGGVIALGMGTRPVYAHGFGPRQDLPLPIGMSIIAAGAAVAFSFVIAGAFLKAVPRGHKYWRHNLWVHPWFRTCLGNRWLILGLKLASGSLLLLVIAAGMLGNQEPTRNLAPTFVWIIFWIGLAFVSAFVGNVWALVNPWKAVFELVERLVMRRGESLSFNVPYPRKWGIWPAALLFLTFAWIENVFPTPAQPLHIARMALIYSLITWMGMLILGKHVWLRHGEAFSVFFGFLSRFSPTEVRINDRKVCTSCPLGCNEEPQCVDCYHCFEVATDVVNPVGLPAAKHGRERSWKTRRAGHAVTTARELNLRPYAIDLTRDGSVGWDRTVFVLLMLAAVSFDGLSTTPAWVSFAGTVKGALPTAGTTAEMTMGTLGLALFPTVFLATYLFFCYLMGVFSGDKVSLGDLAKHFAYTLVPIALAYHLSHFLSLLVIQGQRMIPLLSDPFGFGWDLLGTADYRINIAIVDARFVWFYSVVAIVLGHIIAVYLAHMAALRFFRHPVRALRSQYPMLVLMVAYTVTSLWILAQPLVKA